jgi:hypothetical protein
MFAFDSTSFEFLGLPEKNLSILPGEYGEHQQSKARLDECDISQKLPKERT